MRLQLELVQRALSSIVSHLVNVNALINLGDILVERNRALSVVETLSIGTFGAVLASVGVIVDPWTQVFILGRPAGLERQRMLA